LQERTARESPLEHSAVIDSVRKQVLIPHPQHHLPNLWTQPRNIIFQTFGPNPETSSSKPSDPTPKPHLPNLWTQPRNLIFQTFGPNPETSSSKPLDQTPKPHPHRDPSHFESSTLGAVSRFVQHSQVVSALENQNHPVMLSSPGHSLVQHPTPNTKHPKPKTPHPKP
jgi:hypothetical protein